MISDDTLKLNLFNLNRMLTANLESSQYHSLRKFAKKELNSVNDCIIKIDSMDFNHDELVTVYNECYRIILKYFDKNFKFKKTSFEKIK